MSEKEEEHHSQAGTEQEPNTEQDLEEQEDVYGDEQLEEDETYKNNHDLIGVEGIIRA